MVKCRITKIGAYYLKQNKISEETITLEFHNRVYGYAQKLVKLLDKWKKSCFKITKVRQMLFTFWNISTIDAAIAIVVLNKFSDCFCSNICR